MPRKKQEVQELEPQDFQNPVEVEAVEPAEVAPVAPEPKAPELESIFIPSRSVPYETEKVGAETHKFLTGAVNGKKFKILCDSVQQVKPEVAEALSGLLANIKKGL